MYFSIPRKEIFMLDWERRNSSVEALVIIFRCIALQFVPEAWEKVTKTIYVTRIRILHQVDKESGRNWSI